MTTLDLTKPVQTRDGRKARILCTDLMSEGRKYPIMAAVRYHAESFESLYVYTRDGKYLVGVNEDPRDLINVPVVRHEFVNVFEGPRPYVSHLNFTYDDEDKAREASAFYSVYVGTIIKRYEDEKLVSTSFVKWEAKD